MTRDHARRLLDAAREGADIAPALISRALLATGDLDYLVESWRAEICTLPLHLGAQCPSQNATSSEE